MKFPVYLDYHSTTPVDPEVFEAMQPYFTNKFGNAASKSHSFGWEAQSAVEHSRKIIAECINADPNEIIFTSGTTESINLAHLGIAEAYRTKGNQIITSAIEHDAILDSLMHLKSRGFEITPLSVDKNGFIDLDQLRDSISDDTIFVSIMTANNEIGTINKIKEIGEICRSKNVLFHTDAAQAIGKIPFDVNSFNVDIASFSAHKIYGPKGIGVLFRRNKNPKVRFAPLMFGGGQENSLRPGTLNVPAIVGLGKACEICAEKMEKESERIRLLRNKLYQGLTSQLDDVMLNGSFENRLPGNLNLCFKYVKAETLIMELRDIAVSTGSACTSTTLKPSHVLKAIGLSDQIAQSSIRFGLGRYNTKEEIDFTIDRVVKTVKKLRNISPEFELKEESLQNLDKK